MSQKRDVHKTILFMLETVQHHVARNYQQSACEAKRLSSVEVDKWSVSTFLFGKFFTSFFYNYERVRNEKKRLLSWFSYVNRYQGFGRILIDIYINQSLSQKAEPKIIKTPIAVVFSLLYPNE